MKSYVIENLIQSVRQFKYYAKNENKPSSVEDFKDWLRYHSYHYELETLRNNPHVYDEVRI